MNEKIEKLYDIWAKRNPKFEKRFEASVLRVLSDYGVGASEMNSAKGKILGAGYEPYIMAFFMGLYANKRMPLTSETKTLGQPIMFWGNLDSKKNRNAYPRLREFIFVSLIARTDVDLIALDHGDIEAKEIVSQLIQTMEEYANYGFAEIEDKLESQPDYFYQNTGFLNIFISMKKQEMESQLPKDDDEIEDLSFEDDQKKQSVNDNDDKNKDVLLEENKKAKRNPDRWTAYQSSELIHFYDDGLSIEQLAQYFEKSEESVLNQLKSKGKL